MGSPPSADFVNLTLTPGDGNLNLTAIQDAVGEGSFTLTASDGQLTTEYTFDIVVLATNVAPVAIDLADTLAEDEVKEITLTATDSDANPLTYQLVSLPTHGSVSLSGAVLTYTPELNYNGSDSLTFKANDGTEDSNIAS